MRNPNPIKSILYTASTEGDIYLSESSVRAIQVAINLRLLVADQIDAQGKAVRFKLTGKGYDLAEKIERKQQAIQEQKEREQYAMLQFCSDGVC
jgi:hypothetical protein